MRRLLLTALAAGLVLVGCSSDDATSASGPGPSTTVATTTTAPVPVSSIVIVDDTFAAENVERLCADLGGLADIDPAADPVPADVDRLRAIADTAPEGVAEPLLAVADYGQSIVEGGDGTATRTAALEAVPVLIAYGNEVCDINVPLFNSIAGV